MEAESLASVIEQISGLRPNAWLCVGSGYSREDVKRLIFESGRGLGSMALHSLESFTLQILKIRGIYLRPDSVLRPSARQELLKLICDSPEVTRFAPKTRALRRNRGFTVRLDSALQASFLTAVHDAELEAQLARVGIQHRELRALRVFYQKFLSEYGLYDLPRLVTEAMESLRSGLVKLPVDKVFLLAHGRQESLEEAFWEEVARVTSFRKVPPEGVRQRSQSTENPSDSALSEVTWKKWHSIFDAAEGVAEEIARTKEWESEAILIPDLPEVRWTLMRALSRYGVPCAEVRDPTEVLRSEEIKEALLPLRVVASRFEREAVLSWVRSPLWNGDLPKEIIESWSIEIQARGIRFGLESYRSERTSKLFGLYDRLKTIASKLTPKQSVGEVSLIHLRWLIERNAKIYFVMKKLWDGVEADLVCLHQDQLRWPALIWLNHLLKRTQVLAPSAPAIRLERGVSVHLHSQMPLRPMKRVWVLGLSGNWLEGESTNVGDLWWNSRQRQILASDFAVRSKHDVREQRQETLRTWRKFATNFQIVDTCYTTEGGETQDLGPLLEEMFGLRLLPEEMRGHRRWIQSTLPSRLAAPQCVTLSPLVGEQPITIRASELESLSRCEFQGMASYRWRLRDWKEPGPVPWPESQGILLHKAVEKITAYGAELKKALDEAWIETPLLGFIHSPRMESLLRNRYRRILEDFFQQDEAYRARSGVTIREVEAREPLEVEFVLPQGHKVVVRGVPDRIDEHPDGYFVLDYKTSSSLPHGREMVDLGYRLQLPLYAIGVRKRMGREVLGAQFVPLVPRPSRTRGILLKKYNGADRGSLTQTRSTLNVFEMEPSEIWALLETKIVETLAVLEKGKYLAKPRKPEECAQCRAIEVCGIRRFGRNTA